MAQIYFYLGFAFFWFLTIISSFILWYLFWKWNKEKATILFQIYDCILWNYKYTNWDDDQKKITYKLLKNNGKLKKRIGVKKLIKRIKKDINI